MSTHEFTYAGQVIARVEADNKREATAYLKGAIESRELTSREIVALSQSGKGIVDAKTGQVIGGEQEQRTGGMPLGHDAE